MERFVGLHALGVAFLSCNFLAACGNEAATSGEFMPDTVQVREEASADLELPGATDTLDDVAATEPGRADPGSEDSAGRVAPVAAENPPTNAHSAREEERAGSADPAEHEDPASRVQPAGSARPADAVDPAEAVDAVDPADEEPADADNPSADEPSAADVDAIARHGAHAEHADDAHDRRPGHPADDPHEPGCHEGHDEPEPDEPATPTTPTFRNTTPVVVPTGPGVVTSTIDVSGADAFLWDVDVTVTLPHTFAADLDVTLTSPSGTIVTLTTDNGADNDDVFADVVWDDSANLGGSLPYTSNAGLTTDQSFVDGRPQRSLAPEEPLDAFFGEDPNGTWTLTISDDQFGDGGSLDAWSLAIAARSEAPTLSAQSYAPLDTASFPRPLLDAGLTVSSLTVPAQAGGARVCNVTVSTTIRHSFAADLDVSLTSPSGTVVTLTSDNGAGNDDVFAGTLWDDQAAPGGQVPYSVAANQVTDVGYVNGVVRTTLTPEESLGAFRGEPAQGVWTLSVSDDTVTNTGTLDAWSLNIDRCEL